VYHAFESSAGPKVSQFLIALYRHIEYDMETNHTWLTVLRLPDNQLCSGDELGGPE